MSCAASSRVTRILTCRQRSRFRLCTSIARSRYSCQRSRTAPPEFRGRRSALRTASADQASRTAVTIATTAADNAPITTPPRTTAAAATVN